MSLTLDPHSPHPFALFPDSGHGGRSQRGRVGLFLAHFPGQCRRSRGPVRGGAGPSTPSPSSAPVQAAGRDPFWPVGTGEPQSVCPLTGARGRRGARRGGLQRGPSRKTGPLTSHRSLTSPRAPTPQRVIPPPLPLRALTCFFASLL